MKVLSSHQCGPAVVSVCMITIERLLEYSLPTSDHSSWRSMVLNLSSPE